MSMYHQIFVRTERSGAQLAADVGLAAGSTLTARSDDADEGIAYAGKTDQAAIEIEMSHEFDDDYGIPFSRYPVVVTVRDFNGDKACEEQLARSILRGLCGRADYSLMLVFNLSSLLDQC